MTAKICNIFFTETIYFNNGPNTNYFTWTYLGKIRHLKMGRPGPPEIKVKGPAPPGSATYVLSNNITGYFCILTKAASTI